MSETLNLLNQQADAEETQTEDTSTGAEALNTGATEETASDAGEAEEEVSQEAAQEEETQEEEIPEPTEGAFHLDWKGFKEKYPEAIKEFPEIKRAVHHGRQMLEIFPSIEDARDAAGRIQGVEVLTQSMLAGDPGVLLDNLVDYDKQAAGRFIDNLLPTIEARSQASYARIIEPVITKILIAADKHGQQLGEEKGSNLRAAAIVLNHFLTGRTALPSSVPGPQRPSQTEQQLAEQNRRLREQGALSFHNDIYDEGRDKILGLIDKRIDPKLPQSQREYLKDKIFKEIGQLLESDTVHMSRQFMLFKQAMQSGMPREAKGRIISAYLARAGKILPQISQKHLKDFVASNGQRAGESKKIIPGSAAISGVKRVDPQKVDWNKTSTEDFLNNRIALKGAK